MRHHVGRQSDGRCARCSGVKVELYPGEPKWRLDSMCMCSTCGAFAGFLGTLVNLGYRKVIERSESRVR